MKKIAFLTSLFTALIIGVISCSKDDGPTPAEGDPKITGFTPTSGPVGTQITITGENFGTTAAANTVKIGTATAAVASASATTITATVPQGATTGKVSVTVGGKITTGNDFTVTAGSAVEVVLNNSALTLFPFAHYAESLSVTSDIGTNTIAWTSSDTSVATVDQNGLVTPLAVGTTTVTATVAGIAASATVTVADGPVTSLILDNDALELSSGGSAQVSIATLEADVEQTGEPVWNSSDETVATVDQDGNVTAVGAGTATITVTVDNASASLTVTVNPDVYVAGLTANGPTLWKNGEATTLPNFGESSIANDLFVTENGDVYAVGNDDEYATIWFNGVAQTLSENLSDALSVFVTDNGDVYVAGYERINGFDLATLWMNGTATHLGSESSLFSIASSVFVDGNGDVYVAGTEVINGTIIATLWVNGTVSPISEDIAAALANSVFVADNGNVFITGGNLIDTETSGVALWLNGEEQLLTIGLEGSVGNSVFVADNDDVYVAGYDTVNGVNVATLWFNGTPQALTDGAINAEAASVVVHSNGNVYVAGKIFDATAQEYIPVLWINGEVTMLPIGESAYGNALSVFVK